MFGNTLQRMIFFELMKVFLLSLIGLTGMFLLGGLVAEMSQRGLAPTQIFAIIPLMIPSTMPYTIPATTLFATCYVYGRLAADNEITALRAAGVHLWKVFVPSLILGIGTTGVTAWMYYEPIPLSIQALKDHLVRDVNEVLYMVLKRQGCIKDGRLPYAIFVREVHGQRLIDPIFKKKDPQTGLYGVVVRAKEATMRVEERTDPATGKPATEIVIEMIRAVAAGEGNGRVDLNIQNREIREKLPPEVFGDKQAPRASDMTWNEVLARRAELTGKLAEFEAQFSRMESPAGRPDSDPYVHQYKAVKDAVAENKFQVRVLRNELHLRPAMAIGCLCFVLLGCPVGVWASRSDFLSTFVICFLPAMFVYYPLLLCGTKLARSGKLPVLFGIWSADLIFLAVAVVLCWRMLRK